MARSTEYHVTKLSNVITFDLMEFSMDFDIVTTLKIFVSCIIFRFASGAKNENQAFFFYGLVSFDSINLSTSWVQKRLTSLSLYWCLGNWLKKEWQELTGTVYGNLRAEEDSMEHVLNITEGIDTVWFFSFDWFY